MLEATVLKAPIPRNDNFCKMYETLKSERQSTTDMEFLLRGKSIRVHGIVFTTGSEYFRKAVKNNDKLNKR